MNGILEKLTPAWRQRLGWGLVAVGPLLQLWYMHRYAVNVMIWDEWQLVDFLRAFHDGGDWWAFVFRQHNEHRIAALRLPLLALAEWSHWNVLPQMYFGFLLQLATLAGLWRICARRFANQSWRFAPIALLAFTLMGFQIFLYGMMFVWSMLVAGTVWSLYLVGRRSWPAFAAAAACGVVASFTLNNGLLVWPLGLVLLLLAGEKLRRILPWTALGIAVFAFYYHGYVHPAQHPSLLQVLGRPLAAASFFLANVGAVLGAGSYWASCGFGAVLLVLTVAVWGPRLRRWREWAAEERVVFCLVLFALLSSAAIVVARMALSIAFAVEPRYVCFTVLVPIALCYQLLAPADAGAGAARPLAWALLALLGAGHLGTTLFGREQLIGWAQVRRTQVTQLQNFDQLSDPEMLGIFHTPSMLRAWVAYMRPRSLGVFHDAPGETAPLPPPQAVASLRVQRWQEGLPTAPIVDGHEVVQTFRCPVDSLADLAVPFATSAPPRGGTIVLVLAEGERELARAAAAAAGIGPNEWVTVVPVAPIAPCFGRQLTLTVRTEGIVGGEQRAWTYPAYVDGELRQAGGPDLAARSLGLEINRGRP